MDCLSEEKVIGVFCIHPGYADVTAEARVSADVTAEARVGADVTAEARVSADVTAEARVGADVTAEARVGADVTAEARVSADVTAEARVSADVTAEARVSADVTADAAGDDSCMGQRTAMELFAAVRRRGAQSLCFTATAPVTLPYSSTSPHSSTSVGTPMLSVASAGSGDGVEVGAEVGVAVAAAKRCRDAEMDCGLEQPLHPEWSSSRLSAVTFSASTISAQYHPAGADSVAPAAPETITTCICTSQPGRLSLAASAAGFGVQ